MSLLLLAAAVDPLSRLKEGGLSTPLPERLIGLLGVAAMLAIACLLSYDRRAIPWRLVGAGLALQTVFGLLVLKTAPGRAFFEILGKTVNAVLDFVAEGARFCFGYLVDAVFPAGIAAEAQTPVFAFRVLPTIIFVSSLMSILYYLGVMQVVVKAVAWVMQRTLGTSGAETLSASANIFMGQTEAPLLVKPFVARMTPSELFTIMVGGFATIAGGVMAAYIAMLQDYFPAIAGHLLAASVMNAPAGLFFAKMIRPETAVPVTKNSLRVEVEKTDSGLLEAAANGAATGLTLALNVAGMLIAFIALIAMLNFGLSWLGGLVGYPQLTIQVCLGALLRPLAWVMGVPWSETSTVGGLMGVKVVMTELVAYSEFARGLSSGALALSPRSAVIVAYALLGFANFGSIAIQIGGIGGLAPERRGEIACFGLRAMIAGNLAAFTSAAIAGMLL